MIEQEGLFDPPSFVGFRLSIGGQAGGFTIIRPVRPEVFQKKFGVCFGAGPEKGRRRFMFYDCPFFHRSSVHSVRFPLFALRDKK